MGSLFSASWAELPWKVKDVWTTPMVIWMSREAICMTEETKKMNVTPSYKFVYQTWERNKPRPKMKEDKYYTHPGRWTHRKAAYAAAIKHMTQALQKGRHVAFRIVIEL